MNSRSTIYRVFKSLGLETDEKREGFRRLSNLGEPTTVVRNTQEETYKPVSDIKEEGYA